MLAKLSNRHKQPRQASFLVQPMLGWRLQQSMERSEGQETMAEVITAKPLETVVDSRAGFWRTSCLVV